MDTLEELRARRRDLYELGDSVAAALLEHAERCFLSWQFDAAERYMERALNQFMVHSDDIRSVAHCHGPLAPTARTKSRR